jgi:hypothetical protein
MLYIFAERFWFRSSGTPVSGNHLDADTLCLSNHALA